MRHYLMYRECKISEITKSSEKLRGFFMHKEGVQKVFGTLDLFVSLLETEIKYPILQGGILPFWTPSSMSMKCAVKQSNQSDTEISSLPNWCKAFSILRTWASRGLESPLA